MAHNFDNRDIFRPITVEVKEGNPLFFPQSNNVDQYLLDKLFPHKRKATPTVPVKTQTVLMKKPRQTATVDQTLMSTLGFQKRTYDGTILIPIKGELSENSGTSTSSSPSPPTRSNVPLSPIEPDPDLQTIRDALNHMHHLQSDKEILKKKRIEAVEAQIEKDRAMARYYKKKLELLERQT